MATSRLARRADRALRGAVKATAAAADFVRRPPTGVVVLLYHRVGARSGSPVDLPAALFDEQMAIVAERGAASLDRALDVLGGGPDGPCVAVTFDDGTADLVDVALPILVQHGIPATFYVATAFVDDQRPFPDNGTPVSWDALRDAVSTGLVSIGSHTHRHLLLDRASPQEVADELARSVESITSQVGRPPLDFAYPKGLLGSPAAQAAVGDRFRSAALAGTRANVVGRTDVHRLARSPIQVNDGLVWFRRKVAGGMELEDKLRAAVNRRRYAQAIM
jgi:peptidoglycan/xylan/chitin deacetylase (PgdA/CDA1 family)